MKIILQLKKNDTNIEMENVGDKETISPSPGLNELDLVVPQSPARNNSCFICKKITVKNIFS